MFVEIGSGDLQTRNASSGAMSGTGQQGCIRIIRVIPI